MGFVVGRRALGLGALMLAFALFPSAARATTKQCTGKVVTPAQLGTSTPSACATPIWTCERLTCTWTAYLDVWAYFNRGAGGSFDGRARVIMFPPTRSMVLLVPPAVFSMGCTAYAAAYEGKCTARMGARVGKGTRIMMACWAPAPKDLVPRPGVAGGVSCHQGD